MIHIVTASDFDAYRDRLEQAWRLRHRIFVEEMGWSAIARPDGREIDEFDDDTPCISSPSRTMPWSGTRGFSRRHRPYVLSTHLPELCEGEPPAAPHIVEWSRIGVADSVRTSGRRLNPVALAILTGIVEWGIPRGIRGFVADMPTSWLLRLLQLHIHALPLGLPRMIDNVEIVAVNADFDARSLRQLQAVRGSAETVLAHPAAGSRRLAS